jgi:hypothetical protein
MTYQQNISRYISRIAISLLLLMGQQTVFAQGFLKLERDSVPLFRGFAVSADLVGAAQMMLGDYGQYEGALRLNLHDQYFPIVEVGYGKASREDDVVTNITYKTQAPYFRAGVDFNLLKKKHQSNRLFAGFRYAYTSYKVDIWRPDFEDPYWKTKTFFGVSGEQCSQHWLEAVVGIDAKVFGPFHLGWSVRYKQRLKHDEGLIGKTWYVPGYGIWDSSELGGTFNFIIDI